MISTIPNSLMKDKIDLYGFAYGSEAGAKIKEPVLKQAGIRCMVQNAPDDIVSWYWQRKSNVHFVVYLIDAKAYAEIKVNDRVTFDGNDFRVAGRNDMSGLGRVFRIDLASEVK